MRIRELHRWEVTPREAAAVQRDLRGHLRVEGDLAPTAIRTVVGVDNAYLRAGARTTAIAVAVALTFPALELLEVRQVTQPVTFPYVPGLLAFRELPAMIEALRQLRIEPDVVLVDAHGYAHPRRFGAAAHLGLLLERPTIGCAKSRLVGNYTDLAPEFGAQAPLLDKDEVVGAVLRSRAGKKPLYVSVGNLVSLPSAVAFVLACCRGHSIMPEPTRIADAETRREAVRLRAEAE